MDILTIITNNHYSHNEKRNAPIMINSKIRKFDYEILVKIREAIHIRKHKYAFVDTVQNKSFGLCYLHCIIKCSIIV